MVAVILLTCPRIFRFATDVTAVLLKTLILKS
jgi:hypothetical protein